MLKINRTDLANIKLDLRVLLENAPVSNATKLLYKHITQADLDNKTIITIGVEKERS